MKLKSKDQLAAHVRAFPGIDPNRKAEIADHLAHLPESHHDAVRAVLEREDGDPETRFVRGCFAEAAPASQERMREEPSPDSAEHPGLPTAA